MLRRIILGAALVGLALSATVHAQAPTIKRQVLQKADVPDGKKHEVVFGMAELPAGVAIGKHSHPGIEQGTVVSGEAGADGRGPAGEGLQGRRLLADPGGCAA